MRCGQLKASNQNSYLQFNFGDKMEIDNIQSESDVYYHPDDLYKAFIIGYKMGLLGVDELQMDAEFTALVDRLNEEYE